jgi:hypothetical protein
VAVPWVVVLFLTDGKEDGCGGESSPGAITDPLPKTLNPLTSTYWDEVVAAWVSMPVLHPKMPAAEPARDRGWCEVGNRRRGRPNGGGEVPGERVRASDFRQGTHTRSCWMWQCVVRMVARSCVRKEG